MKTVTLQCPEQPPELSNLTIPSVVTLTLEVEVDSIHAGELGYTLSGKVESLSVGEASPGTNSVVESAILGMKRAKLRTTGTNG